VTITLGEQHVGKRDALARRAKARITNPLVDRSFRLFLSHRHPYVWFLSELGVAEDMAASLPPKPATQGPQSQSTYIFRRVKLINSGTLTAAGRRDKR